MSRRNVKPTTFHDDSRSSDAGSVAAAPARSKPRANKDPAKDFGPLRDTRGDPQLNGIPTTNTKLPLLGPDGEIQVDFNAFPVEALQKYKHRYDLQSVEPPPPKKSKTSLSNGKKRQHDDSDEDASNSDEENLYRIDLGAWRPRINKAELAKLARNHFNSLTTVRENDFIVQFLYAIKTQGTDPSYSRLTADKILKLRPES